MTKKAEQYQLTSREYQKNSKPHFIIWGTQLSNVYDECQTQSAKVLTLLKERAHQDPSNDTPQPIGECQVEFPTGD